MTIAYLDGRYLKQDDARVSVLDRGFLFADGVYEVIDIYNGRLMDAEPHMDRLERSLAEMKLPWPVSRQIMMMIIRQLVHRNRLEQANGMIYIQITRGAAKKRGHYFPDTVRPTLYISAGRTASAAAQIKEGIAVITRPDIRWKRCDIKSVSLLPNVLTKQEGHEQGAVEVWQLDDNDFVTEGCSTNAWIVTDKGVCVTRPESSAILSGITRAGLMKIMDRAGIYYEERAFTVKEALRSPESFISGSTTHVKPVVSIDGKAVGDGKPGAVTKKLIDLYSMALEKGTSEL